MKTNSCHRIAEVNSLEVMEFKLFFILLIVVVYFAVTHGFTAIISKRQWNGRDAKSISYLSNGLSYAIIHHTAGAYCTTKTTCMKQMRILQDYHQINLNWDDIGYNFLIGGDGNIYEGRGWNRVGAHVSGWNRKSLGIAFIGNYKNKKPNAAQILAAKSLLANAVNRGKLKPDYVLYGHRQIGATECPGTNLWNEIKKWSNWKA